MLRSTLRVSRNFPSGGNTSTSVLGNMSRHSGTGSVVGTVFADWNGNGTQDPGDAALENIPIRLANLGSANTTRSGEFAFVNVPIGLLQVGIDLTSLPVDFAPPTVPQIQVDLARGESKKITFGLVPLGSVTGSVIHDVNANGQTDPGEPIGRRSGTDTGRRRTHGGRPPRHVPLRRDSQRRSPSRTAR